MSSSDINKQKNKRDTCSLCGRPPAHCFCNMLLPRSNSIPVTIYQHDKECNHPLGTVRFLKKGLSNCRVNTVEDDQVIVDPALDNAWLLFPGDDATAPEEVKPDQINNLVVIDGTWRKTRKILHQSPWLQSLPRISLKHGTNSRNYLRKSSVNCSLSTLEAVVETLEILEQSSGKYQSLIDALSEMIRVQSEHIPTQIREKHYSGKIVSD